MMLPVEIEQYLTLHQIHNLPLVYVVTNASGNIVNVIDKEGMLPFTLIQGENITGFLPVFTGLFPVSAPLILPNIQLFNEQYFNIYLYPQAHQTWIFFKEVSEQVQQLRSYIAQAGSGSANSFALLEGLDYLVVKQSSAYNFQPLTFPGNWINQIFIKMPVMINLEESFPFLAFFTDQQENEKYSGIWSQTTLSGNDIHLNAWAITLNNQLFLLIQPVKPESINDQHVIQLARENRLAYEQLKKTKEQLQELLILKDQFVNIVSHDFRSPIATLTDGVSLLMADLDAAKPFDQSHREIIAQVHSELVRLMNYNNKLYNWVKLNMSQLELTVTRVPLDLMLANLNGQFDGRLNEKDLHLKLIVNHYVELDTDYVLLNQAVANLLDNAIKFSPPGEEIVIELNKNSLIIHDSGGGLPKEQIDTILKGYSLKSTAGTLGETGTGLGLSIVVRILKNLNYSLDIETGKGTSFIITFNTSNNEQGKI